MNQAAALGDLDQVKHLHKYRLFSMESVDRLCSFEASTYYGSFIFPLSDEVVTTTAMDGAAENGHMHVLRWLHENRTEGCSTAAMDLAAANNHLDVLEWLHDNRDEGCTSDAFHFAAIYGHLDVIKWLHEQDIVQCASDGEIGAIELAAEHGRLHVVEWLLDYGYGNRDVSTLAIRFAASNGHLHVVEFLCRKGFLLSYEDLLISASGGHLNTVSFILQNLNQFHKTNSVGHGMDMCDVLTAAVEQAASGGHRHVVEFIEGHALSYLPQEKRSSGLIKVGNF